jgi:hypothetical protein
MLRRNSPPHMLLSSHYRFHKSIIRSHPALPILVGYNTANVGDNNRAEHCASSVDF